MKKIIPLLLTAAAFATPIFAAESASENTSRAIILKKEELKGKTVAVDVAMVSRVRLDTPRAEAIGTVLFVVHTWDKKNETRGGALLVAVAKEEADLFEKRYGTAIDTNGPRVRKELETKALRAPLVVLPKGGIAVLDPSGKVAEAIKNNKAEALESAAEEGSKQADEKPGNRPRPLPPKR